MDEPSVGIPLHKGSDNEELNDSKEALIRSEGEPSRELLENRGLQNEPSGPGQAVADQEYAAQSPILALGIAKRQQLRRRHHALKARGRAVDGGTFVESDHRCTRHAEKSAGDL